MSDTYQLAVGDQYVDTQKRTWIVVPPFFRLRYDYSPTGYEEATFEAVDTLYGPLVKRAPGGDVR